MAGEAEPGAGPDRKRYVITDAGVTEFEARGWFGRLGLDGLERRRSGELSGGEIASMLSLLNRITGPEIARND